MKINFQYGCEQRRKNDDGDNDALWGKAGKGKAYIYIYSEVRTKLNRIQGNEKKLYCFGRQQKLKRGGYWEVD